MRAGDVAAVQVGGEGGVPSDASMVLFNATAVNTGGPGFLTVFPCGEAVPPTSTLNFTAKAIVPNFVLARIGTAGQVCLYSMAATDVVIDVAGYVPRGTADIVPLQQPDRLLDTRVGIGGPISKVTPAGRVLQLTGVGGLPDTATAVVVNLRDPGEPQRLRVCVSLWRIGSARVEPQLHSRLPTSPTWRSSN